MLKNHIYLSEHTVSGARTREWIVRANESEPRAWLRDAPACSALARHGIAHVGVARAAHPYEVVRPRLSGMFVMACVGGAGEVLLDNRWRRFGSGKACLAPPSAPNAYRCVARQSWEFVWVRYAPALAHRPIVFAPTPLLAAFDGEPLRAAVLGLYHESIGVRQLAALDQWVRLIDTYVRRFTHAWREDDRLHRLWESVAADLARDWTVADMAAKAGLSDEQLRRLCLRSLGRSPRQQLTWMRIERAAAQIASGTDKMETIARDVGYESVFSFSNTFRRLMGHRPSDYREESLRRSVRER
jgi:AraC-like DNA-binding protein